MKFGKLIAILMFCAGAAFTLLDIGTDVSLAYEYTHEYWNDITIILPDLEVALSVSSFFSILTTMWIGLGGMFQFGVVARFLFRGDARLNWLPKSIRVLLLFCSPILLGPVVLNLYGAVFVMRNDDNIGTKNDILR